jgi:GTPase SAR1 family protein
MKHAQPAELSYFFHGGFFDLGKVITGAFRLCREAISLSAKGIADSFGNIIEKFSDTWYIAVFTSIPNLFTFSFYLIRLISTAIVTPVISILITMIQIIMLLSFFLTASLFFIIIYLSDRIYCTINAIVSHCPVCQSKFSLPIYICPKCGIIHDRLRPGVYGILNRECKCGKELPTIFFNGRHKLEAHCPYCNYNIKDGGLHASWCIPVVGGPSSGKTCYINMAMMSLEKNSYYNYGLRFNHEKNGLDEYETNSNSLSQGNLPFKTTDLRLSYYQFTLTPDKATKQQISLCDVAGELFDVNTGGSEISNQAGFRYVNAFMLLIDPLSISEYRNEVSKVTDLSGYKGSAQHIDEMLDTFVRTLQNMFGVDAKAMLNTDVAVVFTKADIPGLDEKIGRSAILKNAPSLITKIRYETQNKLCEQFLRNYNENNFLISLKSRFKSIQFFTCSALGHVMNGQPFVAANVEEPFFWLMRKKSKIIDRELKRRGK